MQTLELWERPPEDKELVYKQFRKFYYHLPDQFALDCIEWGDDDRPRHYQIEAMRRLVKSRRLSVRAPHGAGKTAMAAIIILWFALTRDGETDWKIPTTASAWRQLTKFLWPEIHKWTRRIKWDKVGRDPLNADELLNLSIKLETGEAFALASHDSSLIEGAHASELLYLFDEAKVIPDATWDSAEGAMSTGNCYWLAVSTPGAPDGRFYHIQRHAPGYEDWDVRHITLDDMIKAHVTTHEYSEQRARQWGRGSAQYKNRILGEFAASEEDAIIPLEWIEASNMRWLEWHDAYHDKAVTCDKFAIDVARTGADKIVFALGHADVVMELRESEKEGTMQTAAKGTALLNGHPNAIAIIDVMGVGAGTYDRMIEEPGHAERVFAFNSSKTTDRKDKSNQFGFLNVRSAAWWHLREMLDPANGYDLALPDDDELTGDLTTPKWVERSGAKIQVEGKDSIRKRIGRSTNHGDAVVMLYWDELEQDLGMDFA